MLTSLRILVLAMMWALVMIAFALFFVLASGEDGLVTPPAWTLAAVVVAGVVVHGVVELIGYRAPPIAAGTPEEKARTSATGAFNATLILRVALCESVAIISVAAAFVIDEGGFLLYVCGAAVALVLMAVHGWPGERPIRKTQASLESAGARSHLREALGLAPSPPPGAIKRL